MSMIRVQNMVPEVYVNESRDFQLIGRMYDLVVNGVKFDAESIIDATSTSNCNNVLLQLLQSKVGFFSSKQITDQDLRIILEAFPYLIKNKGSITAIKQAINVFLKINNIKTDTYISVINKKGSSQFDEYSVNIGISSNVRDTSILTEIFKYILPSGYNINYFFYTSSSTTTIFRLSDGIEFEYTSDNPGMRVLNNGLSSNTPDYLDVPFQIVADGKTYSYNVNGAEVKTVCGVVDGYLNPSDEQFYTSYDPDTEEFSNVITPINVSSETETGSEGLCYFDKLQRHYYMCYQTNPIKYQRLFEQL